MDKFFVLALPLFAFVSVNSFAEEETGYFFDLELGAKYYSDIVIDDTGEQSNEADYANWRAFSVEYKNEMDHRNVSLKYRFSNKRFDTQTQFDTQMHIATVQGDYRLADIRFGLSYREIYTRTDGQEFLKASQVSPFASSFISKHNFLRSAFIYEDKRLDNYKAKSGENLALTLDWYYFFGGFKSYLVTGYKYRDFSANDPVNSYVSQRGKLRYSKRMGKHKLSAGVKAENRSYSEVSGNSEDRYDYELEWEYRVTSHIKWAAEIQYEERSYSDGDPSETEYIASGIFKFNF